MSQLDPRIEAIRAEYGLDKTDFWELPQKRGSYCVLHKALEVIAAKAGITFDMPVVLESDSSNGLASLVVRGTMGDRSVWSIGECSPKNNRNSYPWAMAEKRAIDRVVLKLVGVHGLVYSEEESDDFKPAQAPLRDGLKTNKFTGLTSANSLKQDKSPDNWAAFEQELAEVTTTAGLTKVALSWSAISTRDQWPTSWHSLAKEKINQRRDEIINGVVPDDDVFPGDRPNALVANFVP